MAGSTARRRSSPVRQGVDIFVVGSALFVRGRDMGREIRLIRALADEGYQYGLNDGEPPIPRDRMAQLASLPKHLAHRLMARDRGDRDPGDHVARRGPDQPDGVRDYDLLVPATRRGARRRGARRVARPDARPRRTHWRAELLRQAGGEGAPPAHERGVGHRGRRGGRVDRRRDWSCCSASGPADDEATADALARRITELRIFRDAEGRTNSSLIDVGGAVLLISQFTLFADTRRGRRPGFTGAAPPEQAERLYERFGGGAAGAGRGRSRPGGSGPRWPSSS